MPASVVGLLCCAMVAGAVGFPSFRQVAKDGSLPFPCQDKPCGCRDAASCWKSCCCNTNQQKVAWAKKHGVTVPAFVIAAAKAEEPKARGACCLAGAKPAAKKAACSLATTRKVQPAEQESGTTLVLLNSYRKCQGLETLWNILAQAVVPDRQPPLMAPPAPGVWIAVFSEATVQVAVSPALRPPRA